MSYKEADATIHTSMTDLMTSLVFIFILLLVIYLNQAQGKSKDTKDVIKNELKNKLASLLNETEILDDPEDPLSTIVRLHESKLQFARDSALLNSPGQSFLSEFYPKFVDIIHEHKGDIESINLEGFTSSDGNDLNNMKLSEDRAFSVFSYAYNILRPNDKKQSFLLLTTASGLGERKLLPYINGKGYATNKYNENETTNNNWLANAQEGENESESRRVEFKIRVKSIEQRKIEELSDNEISSDIKEKTNATVEPEL